MRQLILLALGLAGSLYTARRIAYRRYLTPARRRPTLIPFTALILVLGALSVAMFVFPWRTGCGYTPPAQRFCQARDPAQGGARQPADLR